MKRFGSVILCFCVMITLAACDTNIYYWTFDQSSSNVSAIAIVEIDDRGDGYTYTVVKSLDIGLVEQLYADISSLEMKKYGPNLKHPVDLSIVITFSNGEYDLISRIESARFRYHESGELGPYISWLKCDQEQFEALIEKYMNL